MTSGTAPRLSERSTYFFGPLAFSSFPHGHADFLGISGGVAIFALSCFPAIFLNKLYSFHQASIIKAGTFLSIHFSIFFSGNDVSGEQSRGATDTGGSHRAGLAVSKIFYIGEIPIQFHQNLRKKKQKVIENNSKIMHSCKKANNCETV